MAYLEVIDTSCTWICPKTASYKIICVAGGNGGGNGFGRGGDTSFGSYCTANGQWGGIGVAAISAGGNGGYTFADYGGSFGINYSSNGTASPSKNGSQLYSNGIGYGAGGYGSCEGGNGCGKIKIAVREITAGEAVTCSIGAGGSAGTSGGMGNGGCIVVQSMV